jgi:hypothetical protein
MLMVFHGVNGYAECDGNERGKRRRGGDPVVQFKTRPFCQNYVQ